MVPNGEDELPHLRTGCQRQPVLGLGTKVLLKSTQRTRKQHATEGALAAMLSHSSLTSTAAPPPEVPSSSPPAEAPEPTPMALPVDAPPQAGGAPQP